MPHGFESRGPLSKTGPETPKPYAVVPRFLYFLFFPQGPESRKGAAWARRPQGLNLNHMGQKATRASNLHTSLGRTTGTACNRTRAIGVLCSISVLPNELPNEQ